jgi:hypothetical protein
MMVGGAEKKEARRIKEQERITLLLSDVLTHDLNVDVSRVWVVSSIKGRAGVVTLVGGLGCEADGQRAIREHFLAAVAWQLIAI